MQASLTSKDKSIQVVVNHLFTKFKNSGLKIQDHWPDDEMAVGLTDKASKHLVYISISGQPENTFYVSLENLLTGQERPYEPAGDFNNIPLKELEKIISEHLRL
jgi:hypothetical protein